jgi:hypothetical protein
MKKLSERPFMPKPGPRQDPFFSTLISNLTKILGEIVQRSNVTITNDGDETMVKPFRLVATTVAGLTDFPAASWTGSILYVSNGTGNKRLAVSDGTNWRFPDGNVVS